MKTNTISLRQGYGRQRFNGGTLPFSRVAKRRAVPVGAPT